jgi:hypothetical protein
MTKHFGNHVYSDSYAGGGGVVMSRTRKTEFDLIRGHGVDGRA